MIESSLRQVRDPAVGEVRYERFVVFCDRHVVICVKMGVNIPYKAATGLLQCTTAACRWRCFVRQYTVYKTW